MIHNNILRQTHIFAISIICMALLSCNVQKTLSTKDQENELDAIKKVLFEQQDAWNAGNLEKFMEGYIHSDNLTFIGQNGVVSGWDATLERYKKRYPNLQAMGKLSFEIIKTTFTSNESMIMIGKFTLVRDKDIPSGFFTLTWQKNNGSWKIISDHTS